jgi:hypothetical protein
LGGGVTVKGGVAWTDSHWILLHPENHPAPNPVREDGVIEVRFDSERPLVGGWGWWDTRTDAVVWSLPGLLGRGEAALVAAGEGMVVAPSIEAGTGASGNEGTPQPAITLSMCHHLPGFAVELLARHDGSLVVVRSSCHELLLLAPDEAEPLARLHLPDTFSPLTLTGDGLVLIARVPNDLVALSLDPEKWREEARRRAGRDLTAEERRIYLGDLTALP